MKILVLGGTQFIGRHVVQKLLEADHDVTLLNRGQTNSELFKQLPTIKVDRQNPELHQQKSLYQNWDAAIDLSAYYPQDVTRLLEVLNGHAGRYILCSTISVYQSMSDLQKLALTLPLIETDPLRTCTAEEAIDTSMLTYGPRKAECERVALQQSIPTVILRPSVVYGAHDYTDRWAYWIYRAASKKAFILPENGFSITQKTYAPDLATAFVSALKAESAVGKAYNIADTTPLSFRDAIQEMGQYLNTKPLEQAVSIPSEWLLKENLKPWNDIPLWIPKTNLLIHTSQAEKDLNFQSTLPPKALSASVDAFLKEQREPKAGLSINAENSLLDRFRVFENNHRSDDLR